MVRLAPGYHAFNAGEWAKRLWGRVDLAKYRGAARLCQNFLPLVEGPLTKRPGFRFVAPLRANALALRLIPFIYSESEAFLIEATQDSVAGGAFRFHRLGAPVLEVAKAISAITKADPAVVTATAHGYATGDEVVIANADGMGEINGRRSVITSLSSDSFSLDAIDSSDFGNYTSGGEARRVYEVAHDYTADELPRLKWVQSLDVLYLFCPGRRPRTLSRYAETDWRLETPDFDDGPYLAENVTTTAITSISPIPSDVGDLVTIAFSDDDGINEGAGFGANDVGRLARWLANTTGEDLFYRWGVGRIEQIDSSKQVKVRTLVRLDGMTELSRDGKAWRLGAWSDLRGWPTVGSFYKGRLWTASSAAHPESLWASTVDDYLSFAPTPLEKPGSEGAIPLPTAADALFLTAAGEEASLIRWLAPVAALALGTSGGEKTIRGSNLAEAITPETAAILPASSVGVADLLPARIDGAVLFVARDRRRLHELAYALEADGYRAPEMSQLAAHIGEESPLAEIAFQRRPWRVLWARRDDGLLVGFTYDREQEVTAWHRHPLGGTDAKVLGLAVIAGSSGDELWIAAERRIEGQALRSIERLAGDTTQCPLAFGQAFHLDSGLSYEGAPTSTLSGLEHLEGETLSVLADGAVHRPLVVTNGRIALDRPASVVHAGLAYEARFESLNLELQAAENSSIGRPKALTAVDLLFLDSLGGRVGPDETRLEPILQRRPGDAMDSVPPALNGVVRVDWRGGWQREKRVLLVHDQPLPCTLAAFVPQLSVNEG